MVRFAISFISGIAAFNFFLFFPVSIFALLVLTAFILFFRHRENKKKIFIIIFAFSFGILYSFILYETYTKIKFPDGEVYVEGTIVDVPESLKEKIRFKIKEVVVEDEIIHGCVGLVILPELFGNNFAKDLFAPGNRISAFAKLREPNTFRNPRLYSYDLRKDGILSVGYIKQMKLIGRSNGLLTWTHKNRQRLGRIIDNSLSIENALFHKAIIPGLKRGISNNMRDSFSATGLAHLLSISGTHFGLLAFIIFQFIRMIIKYLPAKFLTIMTLYITPTQIAIFFTLPVLVLYALISGTRTPTVRSLIMVFIYLLALFLGRKGQWLNSLSIAAVLILLWQPSALFELSFQLSFLAVLSIGYVLEKYTEYKSQIIPLHSPLIKGDVGGLHNSDHRYLINKAIEKVKTVILITIAAVLGTAPLVAVYFNQFPLISPITNLIITPLVCFIVLPLGFFTGFTALMFNMTSMPLSGLTDAVTHFALRLIKIFSHIPYATLHIHNPSIVIILLYYISLMLLVKNIFHPRPDLSTSRFRPPPSRRRGDWNVADENSSFLGGRKAPLRQRPYTGRVLRGGGRFLPIVLVLCIYIITPYLSGNDLRITFLDVGQGDASFVELPDRKIMLIDGGTRDPDMGRRVIAPYLWSKGIKRVDYIVLSHPHLDHFGGLIYIMNNFDIGEIWLNGRVTFEAVELFQEIKRSKIPYKILRRGDVLEFDKYRVYFFHPYDEFYANSPRGEYSSENSDSLVFKIEAGDASILFTGDIEVEADENLLYLGNWLKSDVLKAPHHGGRTSNSMGFIQLVSPQIAVVSVGKNNIFHHPHKEALKRYEDAGVRIFRTEMDGAVAIISRDESYEIETYQDSMFKKVANWQDEIRNLKLLF